jgi:4-amino-4-deoxy-L-arabinose transferase-like glycosyltransferase
MLDFRRLLTTAGRLTSEDASPATHRVVLALFCSVIYVPTLFRGFINPDETRYAEIIREMLERGDWIVPHLNYVPYFMKPPLVYWLVASLVKVFGFHPVVLRMWPFVAATLTVLATYELGRALGSRRTGLIAGALLATAAEFFILAVSFVTDMIFSAFLAGAWLCLWRYYESGGQKRTWILLFWLCAALSCLTKGPLGLTLLLFTVGVFIVLRGEWAFAFRLRPLLGLAILAAINVPWMILIGLRDIRYLKFFYLQISMAGVQDAILMHKEPFYYYLQAVPLGFFPWTLPAIVGLILAVYDFIKQGRKSAPAGFAFILSIFVGGFVLLSIPAAKMETYSLPIFPAAALLIAHYLDKIGGRLWWTRLLVPLQSGVFVVILLIGAVFLEERRHMAMSFASPAVWVAIIAGMAAVAGLVVASVISLRGRFNTSLLVLGVTAAFVFPSGMILVPRIADWRTSQGVCELFQKELAAADLVVTSDSDDFSAPLSLKRRVAIVGNGGELGMGLFVQSQPPDRPIPDDPFHLKADAVGSDYLLDIEGLAKRWASDQIICLFASEKFLEKFQRSDRQNLWLLHRNGETMLLTNRKPAARQIEESK